MTAHASLGASNSHRWLVCAGAPRLEADFPDTTSPAAEEGTAAHELAEAMLRNGGAVPDDALYAPHAAGYDTGDMVKNVRVYTDHVESLGGTQEYEVRVDLDAINPPTPMFGTVDAFIWVPETKTLHIRDLKYGRGVVVEVEDDEGNPNPQLAYYLLGSVLRLGVKPERMTIGIVQPRAHHDDGPIRERDVTWEELLAFKAKLLEGAVAASADDAPTGPVGDHCRWCKAKAVCPSQRQHAVELAQTEFDVIEAEPALPAPEGLTDEQLKTILDRGRLVEDWIKAVREHALERTRNGNPVPGYKLVEGRRSRNWSDEEAAEAWLRQRYKVGDIFKKKLISPAQAEKLVSDRPRLSIPDDMIVWQDGKPKLAPAESSKPALPTAGEEFTTLPESAQ